MISRFLAEFINIIVKKNSRIKGNCFIKQNICLVYFLFYKRKIKEHDKNSRNNNSDNIAKPCFYNSAPTNKLKWLARSIPNNMYQLKVSRIIFIQENREVP